MIKNLKVGQEVWVSVQDLEKILTRADFGSLFCWRLIGL